MVKRYVPQKNRTDIIRRRLKAAFEEHPGITNKKVAEHCSVSEQAVWKWRRTGQVQRDHIPCLTAFFGKSPDWLLDDLSELREPVATYGAGLSQAEQEIITLMRELTPELTNEFKRHITAISGACRKIKNGG